MLFEQPAQPKGEPAAVPTALPLQQAQIPNNG
jgi:hypothetical protein